MAEKVKNKQTIVHKTQHRKLKIMQKLGVVSVASKG